MSDLVWLDTHEYDPSTGVGAVGVEFAGTAVSSTGFGGTIASATQQASTLVRDNSELMWNEGYYRGYFEMKVSADAITAYYFGECGPFWTLINTKVNTTIRLPNCRNSQPPGDQSWKLLRPGWS